MKVSFSTTKSKDNVNENNVKVSYGAGKRKFPQLKWTGLLILIFLPFLYLVFQIIWANIFTSSPGMIYLERQIINSPEDGTVETVNFTKGDTIKLGDVLMKTKRRLSANRIEQIALLEAERDALKANNGQNWSNTYLLKTNLAYYQTIRDNTAELLQRGAATQAELNEAEAKLREIKANIVGGMSNNTNGNSMMLRLAQVEQSLLSLKVLAENSLEITSSKGGTIEQILVSSGQSFGAGEPLAIVLNPDKVRIITYVEPNDFSKVKYGDEITVKILSSKRKIRAVVDKVPMQAEIIPKGISENMYPSSMRGIQVILNVTEPLLLDESIDGLPVTVNW